MWEIVLIDALILAIGFLIGFMVGDGGSTNMQLDNLRKEQSKLRREIKVMRRIANEEHGHVQPTKRCG